jgi:hypothetical protein
MSHVLEHLVDFRGTLQWARSLLETGGVLAIQAPNRRSLMTFLRRPDYRPIEHPFYWTYRALFMELIRAGFSPTIAPPLLGTSRNILQVGKELALMGEHVVGKFLNYGLKGCLEVNAVKV